MMRVSAVIGDYKHYRMQSAADGGEDGIRTHEALLEPTPLAGERLRPLGHLSGTALDKENRRDNQLRRGLSDSFKTGRLLLFACFA